MVAVTVIWLFIFFMCNVSKKLRGFLGLPPSYYHGQLITISIFVSGLSVTGAHVKYFSYLFSELTCPTGFLFKPTCSGCSLQGKGIDNVSKSGLYLAILLLNLIEENCLLTLLILPLAAQACRTL